MNRFPLYRCLKLAAVAAGLVATLPATAQNYPTRAVRIIAPSKAIGLQPE